MQILQHESTTTTDVQAGHAAFSAIQHSSSKQETIKVMLICSNEDYPMVAPITGFLHNDTQMSVREPCKRIHVIQLDEAELYSRPEHWFDQWREEKPDICVTLFSEHFVRSFECECQYTFADASGVEIIGLIMPRDSNGLSFREVLGMSTANELQQEGILQRTRTENLAGEIRTDGELELLQNSLSATTR